MKRLILINLLLMIAGASVGVLAGSASRTETADDAPLTAWHRWSQMPFSQRVAAAELFQRIARQESAADLFENARYLSAQPPERFQAFLSLEAALRNHLDEMPHERALRATELPAAARAAWFLRELEEKSPEVLAALRSAFLPGRNPASIQP